MKNEGICSNYLQLSTELLFFHLKYDFPLTVFLKRKVTTIYMGLACVTQT